MAGMRIKPEQVRAEVAQPVEEDEIDLLELARALWRGKWIIMLGAFVAILLGGYYAFGVAEREFRSTAHLTLEARTNNVVDLESVISGVSTEQAALNTELEIILSRRLLVKLVYQLDLVEDPEFNTALEPPSTMSRLIGAVMRQLSSWIGSEGNEADPGASVEKLPRDKVIGKVNSAL